VAAVRASTGRVRARAAATPLARASPSAAAAAQSTHDQAGHRASGDHPLREAKGELPHRPSGYDHRGLDHLAPVSSLRVVSTSTGRR